MTQEGTEEIVPKKEESTPTIEEQLDALQAQLKAKDDKILSQESSYKGLQRTVQERTDELKRQADIGTRIAGIEETNKVLAAMIAEDGGRTDGSLEEMPTGRKTDLLKRFDELQANQTKQRAEAEQKAKQDEYNVQAQGIYDRAMALGIKESDSDFWIISDALTKEGNLRKAEAKVSALEAKKVPEEETSKEETEEEIARRYLAKKGLLKSEEGSGGGAGSSREQIIERYIANPDDRKNRADYEALRRAEGR